MVSGIRDNPPAETTLASVVDVPYSMSFLRSFDNSGFCEVNFHCIDTNFCFKPLIQAFRDTRYAERCAGQASRSVYMKKRRKVVPPSLLQCKTDNVQMANDKLTFNLIPQLGVCGKRGSRGLQELNTLVMAIFFSFFFTLSQSRSRNIHTSADKRTLFTVSITVNPQHDLIKNTC